MLICGIRCDLSTCTPSATLDENGNAHAFRFLLLLLLDDLVFEIIEGGDAVDGADYSAEVA